MYDVLIKNGKNKTENEKDKSGRMLKMFFFEEVKLTHPEEN